MEMAGEKMADKKMLFIYNPKAGKAQIKGKLSDILELFADGGYEITVRPTRKRGDAVEFVQYRTPVYDIVVCSGGDGTLDEVVTGMMQSSFKTPIGYIPAGSTNDFGGSLNLPKNMLQAAETLVMGENFPCDIGSFNRDVFVYIAAFGLFTDVSYETGQDMKNLLGHMAYLLEGMKRLSAIRSYHMKVSYTACKKLEGCENGEKRDSAGEYKKPEKEVQVIEDDFVFGMVTNSISVGGFKHITGNNVKLDDGVFEVTLIKLPRTPIELNNLMLSLVNRDIDTDVMHCFRASRLTIESMEEVAWTLDGEYGGSHKEVVIENNYRALEIRVKKDR